MARRARSSADVQERFAPATAAAGRGHRSKGRRLPFDQTEVLAAVCKYFCKGHTATEIREIMQKRHGVEMRREDPYQFISLAASRGWIRFIPPYEHTLREQIKNRCGWLQGVEVVHTSVFDDVGYHGARLLLELLQKHRMPPYSKDVVHVGFAGGHSMRKTAQAFAQLLREPAEGLPKTVVFHAMVTGCDVDEPSTDPNAFFTYFLQDTALQIESKFVGLHAPIVVQSKDYAALRALKGIKEAYASAQDLDIIITSGASWSDPDSMLRQYSEQSPKTREALEKAGCVCDILWRPIGRTGPIEVETEIRAMTLIELQDLPRFIAQGKHVLLVLGPCVACNRPKTEMLEVILKVTPRLITHLVVDSGTARPMFTPA
jgi:DNA-binding transcriptional regulator LsrR (DeoR family)